MGKYVFAYTGGNAPGTDAEREAVMKAWGDWLGGLGAAIVDAGNPFGASAAITASGARGASAPSGLMGYSIISAGSLDEAVGRAKGCPQLTSGGDVEVYEVFEVM